jgi:hypothetical protein
MHIKVLVLLLVLVLVLMLVLMLVLVLVLVLCVVGIPGRLSIFIVCLTSAVGPRGHHPHRLRAQLAQRPPTAMPTSLPTSLPTTRPGHYLVAGPATAEISAQLRRRGQEANGSSGTRSYAHTALAMQQLG